ncbi:cell division protein FtsL [Ferrimonas lipolytica]|uniref:Cell division protein FtsL n=1 Tax=Ferrimonas lipolytica TaxID=2724191 RepID=A0A6H1UJY3_9GAMM|nr:cell division protein FtsL [Ferrimonas lipolytica]QIZ78526.1 cell division protein FtsL [Ferrimonas lipolytica]
MLGLELLKLIGSDLRRYWLVLFVAWLAIGSAFWVIFTAQDARKLTAQYNGLLQQRDQLDVQWRHLLLEEQTLAEHSRIDRLARKQLQMQRPKPAQEQVVKLP